MIRFHRNTGGGSSGGGGGGGDHVRFITIGACLAALPYPTLSLHTIAPLSVLLRCIIVGLP